MNWPRSKYIRIKCKDGSERLVFKSADDAFPLVHKNFSANLKTQIEAFNKLHATAEGEVKNIISGVLYQLDDINRSLVFQLRGVYVAFRSNPCEMDKWLAKEVSKIIKNETQMRMRLNECLNEIRRRIAAGKDIKAVLLKSQGILSKSQDSEDITKEIDKALKTMEKW